MAEVQFLGLNIGRGGQVRDAQVAQLAIIRRRYDGAASRVYRRNHDPRYQNFEFRRCRDPLRLTPRRMD